MDSFADDGARPLFPRRSGAPWTVKLPAFFHFLSAVVLVALVVFLLLGMANAPFGMLFLVCFFLGFVAWFEWRVGRRLLAGRRGWRTFALWASGISLVVFVAQRLSVSGSALASFDGPGLVGVAFAAAEIALLLSRSSRQHFGIGSEP